MNFLGRTWRKIVIYSRLPEMRLFWIFVPLFILVTTASLIYLPAFLKMLSAGFFFVLAVIVLVNNLRLARSNLEIKTEHKQLDSIIQNLNSGVIFYGQDFQIKLFNRAAENIFGLRAEDVIGQVLTPDKVHDPRLYLLTVVIYPSLASKMVMRSAAGADPQIVDLSFDEPRLELRILTTKLVDSRGVPTGFLKLITDRTREVELLRSKSEFITIAAHQLRTPLTAVNWVLETLSKNESLRPEDREAAFGGWKASKKLEEIVNDLLDVSKIEEGRYGYNFEDKDIIGFIEGVLSQAAPQAAQHKVSIYFERPKEKSIILRFDPARIGMVMSNILDNAIRYNIENGRVTVKIEKLAGKPFVQISVKDTGVGIPPDQIKNLFKKFFRAENIMKFEVEGSGLGLYIAKNIVQRHGGEIWAESELNRGTTIFFTLPTDLSLIPPREIATFGEE